MRDSEPPPIRRDPDPFAPLDEQREEFAYGFDEEQSDRGLLRVLGVIAALGLLIAILILPPISLLDRGSGDGGGGGISTSARDELPGLPAGLTARSELYDISVDDELAGPATLTVRLSDRAEDGEHFAFYSFANGEWTRLASVTVIDDGRAAQGQVEVVPANIAVLTRTTFARSLGLIVEAGEAPDAAAVSAATIVSVLAAAPALGEQIGGVAVEPGGLTAAQDAAGQAGVYLGVTAEDPATAEAVDTMLATPSLGETHIAALVAAAVAADADGLHIDYTGLEAARRGPFSNFVALLAERAHADGLGVVVSVPTPTGSDFGAYDWAALTAAADGLWLVPPADRTVFYEQIEAALGVQRDAGVDLGMVSLVLDRRSRERSAEGVRSMTLQDALALASSLRGRTEGAIGPGEAVSVAGVNIDRDAGNSGLVWDDRARAVSFAYAGRGGPRTIWVENRYSTAFRLDLASRFGLGGVAVAAAHEDEALPKLWDTILGFAEDGTVRLELPYGPYLQPQWVASDGLIEGGGDAGVVVWRAPQRTGTYDITLVVSDGVVFVGQQIALRVSEPEPIAPAAGSPSAEDEDAAPDESADAEDASGDGDAAAGSSSDDGAAAADTGDAEDTAEPTPEPTVEATPEPTVEPTPEPSATPSTPPGPAGN
jgi:hypothetical protein